MSDARIQPGSVVQILEMPPERKGWEGAFLLVTERKSFGVQGFVHHIETHADGRQAFVRLTWAQIAYIGEAVLAPGRDEEANHGVQGP